MQIGITFICINTLICDRADFMRSIELKIFAENICQQKNQLQYLRNERYFPFSACRFKISNLLQLTCAKC